MSTENEWMTQTWHRRFYKERASATDQPEAKLLSHQRAKMDLSELRDNDGGPSHGDPYILSIRNRILSVIYKILF